MKARALVQGPPVDLATLAVAASLAEIGALRGRVLFDPEHVADGLGLTARVVNLRVRILVHMRVLRLRASGHEVRRQEVEFTPAGAALMSQMVRPLLSLLLPPMLAAEAVKAVAEGRAA